MNEVPVWAILTAAGVGGVLGNTISMLFNRTLVVNKAIRVLVEAQSNVIENLQAAYEEAYPYMRAWNQLQSGIPTDDTLLSS